MRAEKRLFQAWREHHLIQAIDQVIFEVDERGRWSFLNDAWSQLSGFSVVESVGRYLSDFLVEEDEQKAEALLQAAWESGDSRGVLRIRMQDGRERRVYLDMRTAPDRYAESKTLVGMLSDASGKSEHVPFLEAQMQEAVARREQQVLFSTHVAQQFASGRKLDELYGWFVEELNRTFGYYHTQLYLHDERNSLTTLVAASGDFVGELVGQRLQLYEGERALRAALVRRDIALLERDNKGWQPPSHLHEASCVLAAPILLADAVLGAVLVYGQAKMSSNEDGLLLKGLTAQLATLIEGARLREETEERLAELDNLQRLMQREAWLQAQRGSSGGTSSGYRFDRRLMETLEVDENGQEVSGADEQEDIEKAKQVLARPLSVRGQRFGIIGIEDDPDNPLSADDVQLLDAISQQVAEAMENARLLEQTQKRAVELETVARVSTATSTILDKDKLLQGVVELTRRSFSLYHAHIYLLDDQGDKLVLAAGSGEAGRQMVQTGWQIALDEPRSIVARAARARKGIIVNDVRSETGFLPNPLLPATRSELAVPMISGNRLLGVLDVQSSIVNYFTQDDVRIQSALAGQVATALQNATLYQEQLETAEKLREFDRLKSEFLASMSHELRTPLNSVIGFADVLLEGIDGELNERMREDVQLIRNSGQHLRELIGDILDMSKIEAGMMDLRYEMVDVPSLRQEIEGFARTQLMTYEKDLQFRMLLSPEVSTIEADLTRFKQVLFNLVSNAIKFTSEGSVTLEMTVEDENLVVRVSDTGIGIKEDNISIVFEQFRQVDGSLTRTAGGTGLGLPISRSLVELHGGDIWVESEPGEGTDFYFTIPLERARPNHAGIAKTERSG